MMSRIEQVISDIEAYLDDCKFQPFSNTKIIVDKDQLEDMLAELRLKTPEEIKKYQKIINNKEAILNDAKEQADAILDAAKVQTEELINEHEIMQRAYAQANQLIEQATAQAQSILDNATEDANSIRMGAVAYTDDMLSKLQYIIEHSIKDNKEKYTSLISDLENVLAVVNNNRNELNASNSDDDETDSEQKDSQPALESAGDKADRFDVDVPMSNQ
uniref:vacuolar family H+-ATPase subunit H n=1 Tax=Lachnospira sp. TaxID=2049031 RepID=UPI003FF15146